MTGHTTHESEKYARYRETVLEFCDGGPQVDLRAPLDGRARRALADLAIGAEFSILTAENPRGANDEDAPTPGEEQARERANRARTATLLDELRRSGAPHRRVDGVAPDGSYRERCVAVGGARDAGAALARQWRQLALFWYDGQDFWLLPAEADRAPQRLP